MAKKFFFIKKLVIRNVAKRINKILDVEYKQIDVNKAVNYHKNF